MLSTLDRNLERWALLIFYMMLVVTMAIEVIRREVFAYSSVWGEEIVRYAFIYLAWIGAAAAVRERAHIRITLLVNRLPRALQVGAVVLADGLWAGFVIFMIVQTTIYTQLLFNVTYMTPGLGIEQRWVQMIIPMAFALMLFRIGQVYWRWGRDGWKGLPL
ncbi:MAG TPA: TRAP transporter small permease [Roseovarius sp.]|nr:TRAP transporter small permease [Roseovarius sp.]